MNNVKIIREFLGLSQRALGEAIGCTQGNVGHYETGKFELPIDRTKKLKDYAESRGLDLSLDQIHGMAPLPNRVTKASVSELENKNES